MCMISKTFLIVFYAAKHTILHRNTYYLGIIWYLPYVFTVFTMYFGVMAVDALYKLVL